MLTTKIEKLVFGGQGLGRVGEKVAFVWGGLPGEEVAFIPTKSKKNFVEGVVKDIITPSPERRAPVDDHYLSCSPWQIMSYEMENAWKQQIAVETYRRIAGIEVEDMTIASPAEPYGYRNKMEYNFFTHQDAVISLAFHNRGTHLLTPIGDCALATPAIIARSHEILDRLNDERVPRRALKSVIIRSNERGQTGVALFLKDREWVTEWLSAKTSPSAPLLSRTTSISDRRDPAMAGRGEGGVQVYYSDYRSPASVPTELLYSVGNNFLESELQGTVLRFGMLSFFQINQSIFSQALSDIGTYVTGGSVVDYYSGVGSISLPLRHHYAKAVLVEENAEAVAYAKENIIHNGITNAEVRQARAEDALEWIREDSIVILDPPRTGLHENVAKALLKIKPARIIYLSCGLDTHARDIAMLQAAYRPVCWKLYNFFPRTPHIEGLCVLERA